MFSSFPRFFFRRYIYASDNVYSYLPVFGEPGARGLCRGVCPAQVLSSVRDLAALKSNLGVDFMGGEQIPDGCVVGCLWSLQLFPGDFWIEISPDVFLKGTVGEGRYLFSVEHRRYFLYPHPKGVPYPSMPWNLHGRSIVAHKTGTSQTINLMLSTIHLVIKSAKQKVAGSCTSAATNVSIRLLLYFHSRNSHQEISERIRLPVFFSPG